MEDRAKFIGYQECPGHAPLALYNVLDRQHRLYGSTVSAATLAKENIPVPETPKYYDPDQLAMGIKVEAEHTADPAVAEKIAKDHLDELPDYYTRLAKMESEAGLVTKTNPEDKNCLAAWEIQLMQGVPNIGQFTPEQIKELKRRVKSGELGTFKAPWAGQYGTTKTFYQKQSKTNPANKSYKGDIDVKAIGNIPAPRPGMMMVVNPSGPKRWSMAKMEQFLAEKNATDGTNFSLVGAYGQYELWSGGDRIDAGSLQDVYNAWIKARYNKKYQAKKNPALLVLNPSKLQRWHDKLDRHYQTLVRLAVHMGLKDINGKKLSSALLKLENQARKATTDYANGDIDEAQMDKIDSEVTGKVFKLFGKLPGFFVNRDPRGYALKIDDKYMPKYEKVGLERDWGGYGILSPEISKENPAKVPCRYCGRPSEDKSGVCLVCANKYEKKNPVKDFNAPHILTQNGVKKCTGTANECLIWMQKNTSYSWDHAFKHEGWKLEPIHKTKKNPMAKDMTSYRQKQDIKSELQRMAKIQPRVHPEFLNLKAAAEYVEKNIAPVGKIVHGKNAYIIRHAKGIAAFSTTKNNKLIML